MSTGKLPSADGISPNNWFPERFNLVKSIHEVTELRIFSENLLSYILSFCNFFSSVIQSGMSLENWFLLTSNVMSLCNLQIESGNSLEKLLPEIQNVDSSRAPAMECETGPSNLLSFICNRVRKGRRTSPESSLF